MIKRFLALFAMIAGIAVAQIDKTGEELISSYSTARTQLNSAATIAWSKGNPSDLTVVKAALASLERNQEKMRSHILILKVKALASSGGRQRDLQALAEIIDKLSSESFAGLKEMIRLAESPDAVKTK